MYFPRRSLLSLLLLLLSVTGLSFAARERLAFDADWRFAFGHPFDTTRDFGHATGYFSYVAKTGFGDGPAAADFDDRAWRSLDLPHDWAVEAPFSAQGSHSHGYKAAGKGFPDRAIGWYRKRFSIPESDLGRRITIQFDGVFRDSRVWLNGFYLGQHPSGYTGFEYDLTDYLNYGGENVISVRADATLEEGWFYEGAGIYRHVALLKTSPVHVKRWGTAITTELSADHASATVAIDTELRHAGRERASLSIEHAVFDPFGAAVARFTTSTLDLAPGAEPVVPASFSLENPALWSTTVPHLYRVVTTLRDATNGTELDRYDSTFGVRSVRFDPDHGFFLNGTRVLLKGVNLHQDHAGLGSALPDAMYDFRLRRLMDFGINAIRTGHRPPAPEFLDACDRLGLLVIDEHRLMGVNPAQLDDLRDMIRRDRNHPSVIIWSVGNEEWAIESNILGARITRTMQDFARRLDPSRRTTVAISGGWGGSSTTADVVGYNYINQSDPDQQHADFPDQPGIGTEETTTQSTRGIFFDDRDRGHIAPLEHGDTGGNNEIGWKFYAARPFLAGLFYWTGFDYRGEPTPLGWPAVSSQYGLLDLCGFPKDSTYYVKAWWTDEPVLHLAPHWNWAGREGQAIEVIAYSNHDAVELLLNGSSLGRQDMPINSKLRWQVPYRPGRLEARGYRDGELVQTTVVDTTGAPARLTLDADEPTTGADGNRIVVFTVSATDTAGRIEPTASHRVSLDVSGGTVIGVGNGDPGCHEPDRFVPTDTFLTINNWRGRIAPAGTSTPADPASFAPMRVLGQWRATVPQNGEVYDLAGTFELGELPADATCDLYLPSVGRTCAVWLNGTELGRDIDTSLAGPTLTLSREQLLRGLNRIQLIVTPFEGDTRIPERDDLGLVRLRTPAPAASRSLFNGLAQVIVKADSASSPVFLAVTAEGLAPAQLTVE